MALRTVLKNLIDYSSRSGQPTKTRLGRGLTVGVFVTGAIVKIQLQRADVYPSTDEWKTIVSHWPGQCVVVGEPKPIRDVSTYYLIGRVRMMPELTDVPVH